MGRASLRVPAESSSAARTRATALACMLLTACATAGGVPTLPPPVPEVVAANEAAGDPHVGRFPLEEALAGLPAEGTLHAVLVTDEGEIDCTLDPVHAPLGVASFVGLSRGLRPWLAADGQWHTEPYYVDLPWHRAEEGQFVQTGQRDGRDTGGFVLQDEVSYGDSFDRAGVLALANTGQPHTGSVEFFVTTGPAPHLEGAHTILGQCDGEAVVRRVEQRVARGEPPRLLRIDVTRR
jgi:peptidyl-prolyl cis-trans isomerase A (cyclophilin A)